MKKLLLVALVALGINQVSAQKGLELGVYAQPQNTWILNQEDLDKGAELDYQTTIKTAYGVNVGFNFTNTLGIRSGLMLSTQGQKYKGEGVGYSFTSEQKLSYIKVPVLLKFNSNPSAKTSFLFNIGPEFGVLSKAQSTSDGTYLGANIKTDNDNTNAYNNLDIAAVMGLGLQANLGHNLNLNFMFRFSYSIMDIENKDAKNSVGGAYYAPDRTKANNLIAGFQLGLNYTLFGETE